MAVAERIDIDKIVRVEGLTVIAEYPEMGIIAFTCQTEMIAELRAASIRDLLREWIAEANRRHIDVGA